MRDGEIAKRKRWSKRDESAAKKLHDRHFDYVCGVSVVVKFSWAIL